jgi:hypothetical protein
MIELKNNSAFDNVNVPFKLYWEQCDGIDWAISIEKGFRQLLIIDVIGNIAAEITIPHKIKRDLTLDMLIGITKLRILWLEVKQLYHLKFINIRMVDLVCGRRY